MNFAMYAKGTFLTASAASSASAASIVIGLLLVGFDLFWLVTALAGVIGAIMTGKMKYSMAWWATIFPLGMFLRSFLSLHVPFHIILDSLTKVKHSNTNSCLLCAFCRIGLTHFPGIAHRNALNFIDRLFHQLGLHDMAFRQRRFPGKTSCYGKSRLISWQFSTLYRMLDLETCYLMSMNRIGWSLLRGSGPSYTVATLINIERGANTPSRLLLSTKRSTHSLTTFSPSPSSPANSIRSQLVRSFNQHFAHQFQLYSPLPQRNGILHTGEQL